MSLQEPKYYRGRIKALTVSDSSINYDENRKFLRNGFVPTELKKKIEDKANFFAENETNEPLSFAEITSFSTWFEMHPEKIAGVELEATSFAFPVKVKGTKKDVEQMFTSVFSSKTSDESEAEAIALALQLELELMELSGLNGVTDKSMKKNIEEEIIKFVNASIENKKTSKFIDWEELTDIEIKELSQIIDIDLRGYKRTLDTGGVIHALKHDNITVSDIILIPTIVKNYDFVSYGKKPNTIVYKKTIGKEYFYVEEIRTGRKKLVIKTLYKRKKRIPK